MIAMLGFSILTCAAMMIARYDRNDPDNALMLFLQDNPLDKLLFIIQLRSIGILILLYGIFLGLRIS